MQAMILAAGLGTRLGHLTADRPKALVEIKGKTLLEITAQKLIAAGCTHLIINAHHFADQIVSFIETKNGFGVQTDISVEDTLLDTGGGIRFASRYFEQAPLLIHNVDIITDLDLAGFYAAGRELQADALLAVRQRSSNRYFSFDTSMQLRGWESVNPAIRKGAVERGDGRQFGFLGIHLISPELMDHFFFFFAFSVVDWYLDLAAGGKRIMGHINNDAVWIDVGTPEKLKAAESLV
mgnify:FL=1